MNVSYETIINFITRCDTNVATKFYLRCDEKRTTGELKGQLRFSRCYFNPRTRKIGVSSRDRCYETRLSSRLSFARGKDTHIPSQLEVRRFSFCILRVDKDTCSCLFFLKLNGHKSKFIPKAKKIPC